MKRLVTAAFLLVTCITAQAKSDCPTAATAALEAAKATNGVGIGESEYDRRKKIAHFALERAKAACADRLRLVERLSELESIMMSEPDPLRNAARALDNYRSSKRKLDMLRGLPTATAGPQGVTMAEYQQLSTGMSYEEVVTILGAPGEELSRTELADVITVIFRWMREDGGNLIVTFQDEITWNKSTARLVSKSQYGLK